MTKQILWFLFSGSFLFAGLATAQQGAKTAKQIKFGGEARLENQPLGGVKVELKKDGQVVKSIKSGTDGTYQLMIDINTTNREDADYVITFSKNKMLPKTVSLNTFIENPTARSYSFSLDVDMIEQKSDDIVVDLPSANIDWNEDLRKFSYDKTAAKMTKKEKPEDTTKVKKKTPKPPPEKTEKPEGKPHDLPRPVSEDAPKVKTITSVPPKPINRDVKEEVATELLFTLTTRTVTQGERIIVYTKKEWKWGSTFYFRKDEKDNIVWSISEYIYNLETGPVR